MKFLLEMFFVFAKVGLLSFGGGYVMFIMFEQELVKKRKWVSEKDLKDYYALAVCTPGIIAVNVATFCGHKVRGKIGGIVATLGMIIPSACIVALVYFLLQEFIHNQYVIFALMGIKIGVVALLSSFVWDLARKNLRSFYTLLIFVLSLILLNTGIHLIFIIILAGALGYYFGWMRRRMSK